MHAREQRYWKLQLNKLKIFEVCWNQFFSVSVKNRHPPPISRDFTFRWLGSFFRMEHSNIYTHKRSFLIFNSVAPQQKLSLVEWCEKYTNEHACWAPDLSFMYATACPLLAGLFTLFMYKQWGMICHGRPCQSQFTGWSISIQFTSNCTSPHMPRTPTRRECQPDWKKRSQLTLNGEQAKEESSSPVVTWKLVSSDSDSSCSPVLSNGVFVSQEEYKMMTIYTHAERQVESYKVRSSSKVS